MTRLLPMRKRGGPPCVARCGSSPAAAHLKQRRVQTDRQTGRQVHRGVEPEEQAGRLLQVVGDFFHSNLRRFLDNNYRPCALLMNAISL
ncbi:uncharacterized protein V6R79_002162 [Siganus canaliculatus]